MTSVTASDSQRETKLQDMVTLAQRFLRAMKSRSIVQDEVDVWDALGDIRRFLAEWDDSESV